MLGSNWGARQIYKYKLLEIFADWNLDSCFVHSFGIPHSRTFSLRHRLCGTVPPSLEGVGIVSHYTKHICRLRKQYLDLDKLFSINKGSRD